MDKNKVGHNESETYAQVVKGLWAMQLCGD